MFKVFLDCLQGGMFPLYAHNVVNIAEWVDGEVSGV